MDSHDETECQTLECASLCTNDCGFFGSAATMNMCSRCYKDAQLTQEQEKLATSSLDSVVNLIDPVAATSALDLKAREPEPKTVVTTEALPVDATSSSKVAEAGPARCGLCRKRVFLNGFNCKCGHVFCSSHRYPDKHSCGFDYRTAGRDAIAKANPVVKAEKLDKI